MTIFNTAFDTTAGSGYAGRIKNLTMSLREADNLKLLRELKFNINNIGYVVGVTLVCGGNAKVDTIPAFNHPIYDNDGRGVMKTFIDARNFGRWDASQQRFKVTNADELLWHIRRAVLQHLWINEPKNTFRDVSILPMKVYCNTIAEILQRRYALNPAEKVRVAIAAAYGYMSFFSNDEQDDFDRIATKIAQAVGAWGREMTDEVLTSIEPISDIAGMCDAIVKASGSVRLEEFNHGLLTSLIAGTWAGTNGRENICVAMEHMPTWLMIVWSSVSEATFRRSVLAKMVQEYDQRGLGDSFSLSMKAITGSIDFSKLSEI